MTGDDNDHVYGCPKCGLLGCLCAVGDAFDNLCKKCHADPCECEGKPVARTVAGICTVCRRNPAGCLCKSHHPVKQLMDSTMDRQRVQNGRPYSDAYIEVMVNESMNFYYNRDAEGLARWLRKALR